MIRRAFSRWRQRQKGSSTRYTFPEVSNIPSIEDWVPLHPDLKLEISSCLHPELKAALNQGRPLSVVEEIAPSLFQFPMLSPSAVLRFNEEIKGLLDWSAQTGVQLTPPNSMNNDGVILSDIGWETAFQEVMVKMIVPLAKELFPTVGGASLTTQHSFIVEYGKGRDRSLGFHVDDSEVTLNLCLGDSFEGSELYFQGRRCEAHRQLPHSPEEHVIVEHKVGVAILHAGAHRHGVLPIVSGRRRNLIMWCRSTEERLVQEQCAPWCGEHDSPY